MPETLTQSSFADLGLPVPVLNVLERLGFVTPTPIQKESIPHGMEGSDVLGIAQTGTGKTLAFGIPMIAHLKDRKGMGLIVVPTRELALQVDESIRKIGTPFHLRTAVLIGGANMHRQIQQIRGGANILVATPGRLMDHLKQGTLRLDRITVAVLDEADRMLDMGFLPDVRRIMEAMPKRRQTMLFSATMPSEIDGLARAFMQNPVRIEVDRAGKPTDLVEQSLLVVDLEEKQDTLERLISESDGTVLVFARTRHGARKTAALVRKFGYTAAELHSDRTLAQRREALDGFKSGKFRVLVATDIAARGIDVKRIELVVNFDVPDNPDDYVHRIGRTGRAGETGRAVTIATLAQAGMVRDVEKVIGMEIPYAPESPLQFAPRPAGRVPRQGSGRGRGARPSGRYGPNRPASAPRPDSRPASGSSPHADSAPRPARGPNPAYAKPRPANAPAGARRSGPKPAGVAGARPEGPHPFNHFMKSPKRRS